VSEFSQGHVVDVAIEVVDGEGLVLERMPVLAGRVEADESRLVRRTLEASIANPDGALTPKKAGDLLHPLSGNRLRVFRGVLGQPLEPLGVFMVSRPKVRDSGFGPTLSLSGLDLARAVSRARWTDPYVVTAGQNVAAAGQALLASRVPGLRFNLSPTSRLTSLAVFGLERDNDPFKDATSLFEAIGHELFFDAAGVVVSRPVPDPEVDPVVASFVEGENSTLLSVEHDLDDEKAYNGVIVVGEGSSVGAPVRADVWDDNPDSPTYYLGPYGMVPFFLTSAFITTQAQAIEAGQALLRRLLRAAQAVVVEALPDPRRAPGDVARVTRQAAGVDAPYAAATVTMPLGVAEPMSLTMRPRAAA
jgi:hypothetical protein